ncbi:MAG: type II toxin-antitoxin system RelB/DinJ family antitoxin [Peptococcaceae bacterium]|nr:type II toxin-antitoxin system RelB/DinJ family antitoxin [Peptococcaceae bacterium]
MTQSMVNFRMDSELKKEMEQVCRDMGMSMTTALTIFIKKVCMEKRIPFEITADPFYSTVNMERLERSIQKMERGDVVHKSLDELRGLADE